MRALVALRARLRGWLPRRSARDPASPGDTVGHRAPDDLAARKALLERDLVYLDLEDLPALAEDDPRRPTVVAARAAMLTELADVERAIAKARKLHDRRRAGDLHVSVENRANSIRRWYNPHDGTEGGTRMDGVHYGYVRGTIGLDGDHVDVFLKVGVRRAEFEKRPVFVIQTKRAPEFLELDEEKIMLGFTTAHEARDAFVSHYSDPRFLGQMDVMSWDEFKRHALASRDGGDRMLRGRPVDLGDPALVERFPDAGGRHSNRTRDRSDARPATVKAYCRVKVPLRSTPSEVSSRDAAALENLQHGPCADAVPRGDGFNRRAVLTEEDRIGDGPLHATKAVVRGVLRGRDQLQVVRRVVQPVAIDVVDVLRSQQRTAEEALHHDAVLKELPTDASDRHAHKAVGGSPVVGKPSNVTDRTRHGPESTKPGVSPQQVAARVEALLPALTQLVTTLGALFPGVPVAGRLRETPSVAERGPDAAEDVASVRLVLDSAADQALAAKRISRNLTVRHSDDYVRRPAGGYRGVHLVVDLDGQPVEVQLRTEHQTAWADAAREVATRHGGQPVPGTLRRYLEAMGDHLGRRDQGEEPGDPPLAPPGAEGLFRAPGGARRSAAAAKSESRTSENPEAGKPDGQDSVRSDDAEPVTLLAIRDEQAGQVLALRPLRDEEAASIAGTVARLRKEYPAHCEIVLAVAPDVRSFQAAYPRYASGGGR